MRQEESAETPAEQPWGIRHVIFGWLLGQVSVILVFIAIEALDSSVDLDDPSMDITAILQAALWVGTLGIPVWLHFIKGISWKDFGWGFQKNDIFSGLLIGFGTQIAGGLL